MFSVCLVLLLISLVLLIVALLSEILCNLMKMRNV